MTPNRTIVLGVTSSESIKLLGALPETLARDGWIVHVVSGSGPEFVSWNPLGVTKHVVPMQRKPSLFSDAIGLFRWGKLLRRIQPDAVSLGTPKAAMLGLLASRVLRIPVRLYILRGLRLESSRGLAVVLLYLFERLTSFLATEIISVSPSLRDVYVSRKLASSEKVLVIGRGSSHGIDTDKYRPQQPSKRIAQLHKLGEAVEAGRPVLGFVGRFSEAKGATALLACRRLLVESRIDHELVCVGPIESAQRIFQELDSLGRPLIAVGTVSDPAAYYAFFDIVLLPTKREGFPNVILEASAFELPVVTTGVTGSVDAVVHGQTGLIVPPDDDANFAETTKKLILDPELCRRLGKQGREWVVKHFQEKSVIGSHVDHYNHLVPTL